MNAVESGDMEMAQRLVDEATKTAGKNLGNGFTVLHSRSGLKSLRQNRNAVLGFRLMPSGHGSHQTKSKPEHLRRKWTERGAKAAPERIEGAAQT